MTLKHIPPKEAFAKIQKEGFVYLDVRTPEEFFAGHPKDAINIPIFLKTPAGRQFNSNFLAQVQEKFSKTTKLVVGCQSGGRSAQACELLLSQGYASLYNVCGSFGGGVHPITGDIVRGWKEEGLPVTCE